MLIEIGMMRLSLLFFLFLLITSTVFAQKYQGDGLLYILGQSKDSSDTYKSFAKEWGMGKKTSLPDKGLKVSKNSETGRIIAITFAGKGYELGDTKFEKYEGQIPFGLTITDDYNTLRLKLGAPKKDAETVSKFSKDGLSIIASFTSKSKAKLQYLKIALGFGVLEYNPHVETVSNTETETIPPSNTNVVPEKKDEPRIEVAKIESNISTPVNRSSIAISETMPADFSSAKASPKATTSSLTKRSEFYRSIMDVMEAGSESSFEAIQDPAPSTITNFWNYRYTQKSNVHIPGEKYNFIYRFPFASSQKDFVVVLKEGQYDNSFKQTYDEFLLKIKSDFTSAEGWKYSNPIDESTAFPLKDFEAQNAKFGSVVLDYHQNPQGQSVLYLRFLLYYD